MRVCVWVGLMIVLLLPGISLGRVEADAPPEAFRFEEIKMFSPNEGWATASFHGVLKNIYVNRGYLLYTYNSGLSWEDVSPPEGIDLNITVDQIDAFFLDRSTAWVVTDKVWGTRDGGQTWRSASLDDVDMYRRFIKMAFSDQDHGWILLLDCCTEDDDVFTTLYQTLDGGQSWTPISDAGEAPEHLRGLSYESATGMVFPDEQAGWVTWTTPMGMGSGGVARTEDGGLTWRSWDFDALPPPEHPDLLTDCSTTRPVLLSPNRFSMLVVCWPEQALFVYSTIDNGLTWKMHTLVEEGSTMDFGYEVSAVQPDTFWVAIWSRDTDVPSLVLYRVIDGGTELVRAIETDLNFYPAIFSLNFVNDTIGWWGDADSNNLYRTADGGQTWTALNPQVRFRAE